MSSVGANIFSNMPKESVKDKLFKIKEQFARDELKPEGSSAAQAEVESRRISRKYVPFRRFKGC